MLGNKLGKFYFLLILIGYFAIQAKAQTGLSSPYSSKGVGYLSHVNNLQNRSMGGIGIGTRNPHTINLANPASLTAIDTTSFVFEGGVVAHFSTLKTETMNEQVSSASLDHLLFGFPVTKWWKSSIGLLPFSTVGYNIRDYSYKVNVGSIQHHFEGSGGLSEFYWANAIQPVKTISVGFNLSYIFGTINRSQSISFPDTAYLIGTKTENVISVGDIYAEFGIQYFKKLKKNVLLVVGGTFNPKLDLKTKSQYLARSYLGDVSGVEIFRDTIDYSEDNGSTILPEGYGFGVSLSRRDFWLFGFDYRFDKWEDFRIIDWSDSLVNSHTLNVGGQYTPDWDNTSYLKRIDYRLGARFAQSYLILRDTRINGFGITFGLGLPLRSIAIKGSRSKINIGFEFGRNGTINNGLIKEQFMNFYFGVSINELWFIKRRYQ